METIIAPAPLTEPVRSVGQPVRHLKAAPAANSWKEWLVLLIGYCLVYCLYQWVNQELAWMEETIQRWPDRFSYR